MEDKNKIHEKRNSLNFIPMKKFKKIKSLQGLKVEADIRNFFNLKRLSMKSDNKIMNYCDTLTKLLGQINSKPTKISSGNNSLNESYNNSNSSEINDDKDSEEEKDKINISPKKMQKINRVMTFDNNNNKNSSNKKTNYKLKINNVNDKTSLMKFEKSPTLKFTDLKRKDSLILQFHRYFFQDGDIDKNNTIIKYNINKIKIDENIQDNVSNEKNFENESEIFNIKNQVINLMDKFDEAFTKEKKQLMISAIKDLNDFAKKYKFGYVMQLTLDWLKYLEDKNNENSSLKNFGYYNQIREIMDKMLKEIKKKVDFMILYREKYKNKKSGEKNEKEYQHKLSNKQSVGSRKKTINKEDLLKSKEIVPIKLDIDIQNHLNLDEIENIIQNLEKGDFGNVENNNASISNKKKILKSHFNNRNDNELEAFNYPFKEEHFCGIF
jgi:hypothetical protein